MTEKTIKPEIITCSQCGLEIGKLIIVENEDLVQLGGLAVREIHGNCVQCGEPFDYSLSARRLERLLRLVTEKRLEQLPEQYEKGIEAEHGIYGM